MPHHLKYRILNERLAVCRLAAGAPVPPSVFAGTFYCVTRTQEELSIVCTEACAQEFCANNFGPVELSVEPGWIALNLEGPFPFAMSGVLASFLQPLAEAKVPIFAISTFDTDYVLIKQEHVERAISALNHAGHARIA